MSNMKSIALALMLCSVTLAQESQPSLSLGTAINVQASDPEYAIELYSEVIDHAEREQDRALAAYNRGVLFLGAEDPAQASDSFRIAGQLADRTDLRRDAMFNLGHALMKEIDDRGEDLAGQMAMDPQKIEQSITKLRVVERAFLDSARIDPSFLAAKKNLERVRMQIRDLENLKQQIEDQQQQDQQSQQGEQGDQQDMADQLQSLADQQREQAQESEQADQQDQSPQDQQQDQQERSEDQQDLSEQTQQAQQQMQQADQSGEQQDAQQDLQEARQAQQEAQEALERGDNQTAAQKQQEAADALDRAAQRVRESQQQSEQQSEGQPGDSQEQGEAEQEQEIDEIAQKLLDKERDERERRQAYRATGRPVRVEKDW